MSDRVVESPDFFKSLPAVSSLTGQKLISMDASGNLGTIGGTVLGNKIDYVNLNGKETAGSEMAIKDFTMKYVKDCVVGTYLHDKNHAMAVTWSVRLTDNIVLDVQRYVCQVIRKASFINATWSSVALVFIPVQSKGDIYIVYQETKSTVAEYSITIRRLAVENIA